MSLYFTETELSNGSVEKIILEADDQHGAVRAVFDGLVERGRIPGACRIKHKVSKAKALKHIQDGAICWVNDFTGNT